MGKYYLGTGTNQYNFQVVDSTGVIQDLNLSGLYLSITGKAADADKLDNYDSSFFRNIANLTGTYTGAISGKASDSELLDGFDSSYFLNGANITGTVQLSGTFTGYYTGAFSGTITHTDSITFHTGLGINPDPAELTWNDGIGTMQLGLQGGNVDLRVGLQNYEYVTNRNASTLSKGSVVYISGAQGNRPAVALALANADSTSAVTFGILAEDIASMADGYAITNGLLTNLNTTGFAEGAALYLSPTISGAVISSKPQAPNHSVLVGFCVRSHQSAGEILVKIQNGVELDELHDVKITSAQNNDIIRYNAPSGVWYNSNTLAIDGTGSHYISGSLGIGISGSSAKLHVVGNARIGTSAQRIYLYDDGNAHIHSTSGILWLNTDDGSDIRINNQSNGNVILTNGTGKVGIGNSNPITKFDVSGVSSINENLPVAFIEQSFTGSYGYGLSVSRNNGGIAALALGADGSNNAIIASNNADLRIGKSVSSVFNEYVRINSNGTLLVNTQTAYAGEGLIQANGRISAVGTGASFGNGLAGSCDPAFFVGSAAGSTVHLFGFGSGARVGLIRGYQDGGGTVVFEFGRVQSNTWSRWLKIDNNSLVVDGTGASSIGGSFTVGTYLGNNANSASTVGFYGTYAATNVGTNITQFGDSGVVVPSAVTNSYVSFDSRPSTAAASFTLSILKGLQVRDNTLGAGSTVTTQTGVDVTALTLGSTIYGIRSQIASGSNKYNLYIDGTAQSYFAGNIGIGTTTPLGKLHIAGGSSSTGVQLYVSPNTGYTNPVAGDQVHPGGSKIILWDDTITPQKASIGMDSNADIWFNNAGAQGGAGFTFYTGNGASASPTARLKITKDGNVGIATITPNAPLDISAAYPGSTTGRNSWAELGRITAGATYNGYGVIGEGFYTSGSIYKYKYSDTAAVIDFSSGNFAFKSVGVGTLNTQITWNDLMYLKSDGRVGIGTTTPSSILDARLSSGATSGFRFKGYSDASTDYLLSLGTQTYPDVFQVKSVNGLVTMGVVGAIGATPHLVLQTNSTERIRILSGGNVGIGVTAPDAKLQVDGHVHIGNATAWDNPASWDRTILVDGTNHARIRVRATAYAPGNNNLNQVYLWVDNSVAAPYGGLYGDYGLQIGSGNSSHIALLPAGNVGVGIGAPLSKLHIVGNGIIAQPASYGTGYVAGLKFRNEGYAHFTIGGKGSTFVISDTGADGTAVWNTTPIDLITVNASSGNTSILGSLTVSGAGRNVFSGSIGVSGPNPTHATSMTIIDHASPIARIIGYGPNASTAGSFSFIGLSSDGTVGGTRFSIDGSGNASFNGTVSATGNITSSTSTNATQTIQVTNSNAANSALSRLVVSNGTYEGSITVYGTGFTTNNAAHQNRMTIAAPFICHNVSGQHYWWIGTTGAGNDPTNANQVMILTTGGQFITMPPSYSYSAWGLDGINTSFRARTVTDSSTAASGTAASAAMHSFGASALAATNTSVTTTNAATVYIAGGPSAGTNQTITNSWGLWNAGKTRLDGDVTVGGNLTINGTTTTVNSTVTTIDDPIITLGGDTAPTVDDNKDRGVEFRWHNGSAAKVGFFGFDDSTGYFTFIPDATNTSEVFSGTQGDIQASNFRGTLIGNSSTTTKLNVTDSRNTADTPETISMGIVADFKANSTNSLSDGGTYNGVLTFRQYGSGTDWSGGRSHQLAFTDNDNIWHRSGTSTSWGTWYKIWHQNNDGAGSGLDADLLDGYNQDTANTANTVVRRDASGNFSAGTISATSLRYNTMDTDDRYARLVRGTVSNVSNAGYTCAFTVTGSALASSIRFTAQGTADSVVVNSMIDLIVNHSQDIVIQSLSGIYTQLTVRVVSDNNENFAVLFTTNHANAVSLNVEVYTYNNETVLFTATNPYSSNTLTHVCYPGIATSATGGNSGDLRVAGTIYGNVTGNVTGTAGGETLSTVTSRGASTSTNLAFNGNVVQGGGTARSTYGTTIALNRSTTFSANSDIGDGERFLSIVNDNSTTNAMATLGFRINPNGGNANAVLDMKFVNTGATSTSKLHYSFNHGGSWADRLTIQSDGNVGIGTTTPNYKLQVQGTAYVDSTLFVNGAATIEDTLTVKTQSGSHNVAIIDYSGNAGGRIKVLVDGVVRSQIGTYNADNTFFNVGYGGSVGICTSSPQTPLHAYASTADSTTAGRTTALNVLTLESENTADLEYTGFGQGLVFRGSTYNNATQRTLGRIVHKINDNSVSTTIGTSIHFETSDNATNTNAPTEKMVIDYAGNIGIGITSPATKLDIRAANTAGATTTLRIGTQAHGLAGDLFGNIEFYWGDPDSPHISSKIYAINTGNVGPGGGGAADIRIATAVSSITPTLVDRLTIKNDGNVGIGITNPYSSLSVKAQAVSWGEGILIDPASTGYSGVYFRTEANQNSSYTGTWAIGKNASGQTGGEILHVVKNGLTGGALHRVDAAQSWKTTGETCFGFNVGIGFTTPDQPLAFADSVAMKIQLNGSNANGYQLGLAAAVNSGDAMMKFIAGETGAGEFGFYTTTNLRLLINKDGNVGIGTQTPNRQLTFVTKNEDAIQIRRLTTGEGAPNVGSGISWTWSSTNTDNETWAAIRVIMPGSTNTHMTFSTTPVNGGNAGLAERMRITDSGKIGINATSPDSLLQIRTTTAQTTIDDANQILTIENAAATDASGNLGGIRFRQTNGTNSANGFIGLSSTGNSATRANLVFASPNTSGNTTTRMTIDSSGNVGIGTPSPGYKLEVNGSFAATTKSFVIKHPTKEGKKLRYGSLEGPENGVYVRGKTTSKVIELPDYWTKLVDPESITVQLTPIGSHQKLYVEKIEDNKVYIANENLLAKNINCFFYILAERADVEKLQVEIDA